MCGPGLRLAADVNAFPIAPLRGVMSTDPCDGCGAEVRIGGGIGDFWTLSPGTTGGMTLELDDDTEHFLCFDCVDALPDYPTAADVDDLDRSVVDGDGE